MEEETELDRMCKIRFRVDKINRIHRIARTFNINFMKSDRTAKYSTKAVK